MSSHVLFGLPSHRALATAALSALPSSFCVTLGLSAHSLRLPFLPCSSGWCFVLVFHRLFFGDLSLFVIWCQPLCTVASSTVTPASRRDVSSPGALVPPSCAPLLISVSCSVGLPVSRDGVIDTVGRAPLFGTYGNNRPGSNPLLVSPGTDRGERWSVPRLTALWHLGTVCLSPLLSFGDRRCLCASVPLSQVPLHFLLLC